MLDRLRPPVAVTAAQRAAWPMVGALVLVVLAVSVGLVGLFSGTGWWFGLVGVSVLVLVVSGILRGLGAPRWVASLLGVVVFAAVVFALFGGGTTIALVVPTPSTFDHLRMLYDQAWQAIDQQGVPAEPLPQLLFFVVGFGGLFAIILDVVANALRLPAFVALAELTVLVVPALLLPNGLRLSALVACALAYFVVLWADGRIRMLSRGGARTAVAVGVGVTAVALGASVLTPGLNQYGWQQLSGGPITLGAGVDPLIDLSADLRQPVSRQVLTYTTTAEQPPYLQLTTLDSFDGTTWQHQASTAVDLEGDGTLRAGVPGGRLAGALGGGDTQTGPPIPTTSFTTKIAVDQLRSLWLPAPSPVVRVAGLKGRWQSEVLDGTLTSPDSGVTDQRYTVTTTRPVPTPDELTISDPDLLPPSVGNDLTLPPDMPPIIARTAAEVTQGDSTPIEEAMDLQSYFHDGGFEYSTDTPDADDPTSAQVVAQFLVRKSGYCVHFATAMTLMARELHIPARIAMGYLPGLPSGHAPGQYAVQSSDLHTWPQLYFADVGWLDFEPTVGRGHVPDYLNPSSTNPTQSPTDSPPPAPAVTNTPPQRHPITTPTVPPSSPSSPIATGVRYWPQLLGGLLVLAVLALPALIRAGRRRGRLARLRRGIAGPELAWRELRDTAIDLGLGAPATETPRAFAIRIASGWLDGASAREALLVLREALERSAFGPPGAENDPRHAALVRAVEERLRGDAGRWTRLRAAAAPASVFRRTTG